ncbi:MAG: HNH endonuclease signature motif containing protein [Candidatus Micrarchaeia archaeon]
MGHFNMKDARWWARYSRQNDKYKLFESHHARMLLLRAKVPMVCARCGKPGGKMTADHIIPLSKGGKTELKNLQWLHLDCHKEKTREDKESDCCAKT